MISIKEGGALFKGVEQMGKTDTSLFTLHRSNLAEGKCILEVLPKVLQRILTEESYKDLGISNPPQPKPKLIAMKQQENEYLDGLGKRRHRILVNVPAHGYR